MDEAPELVEIDRRRSREQSRERALVLEAAGVRYAHRDLGGEWVLLVRRGDEARARQELSSYSNESADWPPPPPRARVVPTIGASAALLWTLTLGTFWLLQSADAFGADWARLGRSQGSMIDGGEWWRAWTSLTLHADGPHVAGNLLFGSLFVGVASQYCGTGIAFLGAVTCGAAGNAVNAWLRAGTSTSLGASTAVFAALGLLVGAQARRRHLDGGRRFQRWIPLATGLAFLGFLGTSGERTDVLAHFLGFGAGLVVGPFLGHLSPPVVSGKAIQTGAALLALFAWIGAWSLAFRAA
ncbi:MAG: rhomboid family intramembrane serine protease [Planctomycetota bacterium JB042]